MCSESRLEATNSLRRRYLATHLQATRERSFMQSEKAARGTLYLTVQQLIQYLSAFIFYAGVARFITQTEVGLCSILEASTVVFTTLTLLGLPLRLRSMSQKAMEEEISVLESIELLEELAGKRSKIKCSDRRPSDQRVYISDISKAEWRLGGPLSQSGRRSSETRHLGFEKQVTFQIGILDLHVRVDLQAFLKKCIQTLFQSSVFHGFSFRLMSLIAFFPRCFLTLSPTMCSSSVRIASHARFLQVAK